MVIKKKAHEKLNDTNLQRVAEALSSSKPITKKAACEMLNISYNTTRLAKILRNYEEEKEWRRSRMDKNRGKPASEDEIQTIILDYLMGLPITDIAKSLYRSTPFVSNVINRVGVPARIAQGETFIPPDECVKEEFEIGEWVWFNKNHPDTKGGKAGMIVKDITSSAKRAQQQGCKAYKIHYWVPIEWKEGMWVPWWSGIRRFKGWTTALSYDLSSIQHLVDEYDLDVNNL